MVEEHVERKLAAILVADVVGYSRLMEIDEIGTFDRLKAFRKNVFEPSIVKHGGRVFKLTGDGALAEFGSAVAAVRSAVEVQQAAVDWYEQDQAGEPIELRIGISLGDVMVQGHDLYGNAINVAARLESLAEPRGICISGNVQEHLKALSEFQLTDLGTCNVKNIVEPVRHFTVSTSRDQPTQTPTFELENQAIGFCTASDGVRIAYETIGDGSPVVLVFNWLTHLELDKKIPSRRELLRMLAKEHFIVRYDARGGGLSDWEVDDISFEASMNDLTAVIDCVGLKRFALIGLSQGAAISAAYAARHPDRVTHLVLYGGYARGRRLRGSAGAIAESDAFITMIREGWGKKLDAYVRMFGSFFMPDANAEQLAVFTEFQRRATPPENAARIQLAIDNIDITSELSKIAARTLVLHVREDARAPFEEGRQMAAAIPDARLVPLEGRNHALLTHEPAFERYLHEIENFLAG